MRDWRGTARLGLALASACSLAEPAAHAQLLLAETPGEPRAVEFAELARASGDGAPVTWLSLRVQRGPVAVVVAVPEGGQVEPALDAWFAALEQTASPNVLLPSGPSACAGSASFVHVSWPRASGAAETSLALGSREDVLAVLDEQGLSLPAELPKSASYVVWSWPASEGALTTRTLRVLGGSAPLSLVSNSGIPVLMSVLTRGATMLPGELAAEQLGVTFTPGQPAGSDYAERLRDWIAKREEPLLETRARGPIFDWSIYDDQISVAPLISVYAKAAAKELQGLDAEACSAQLGALGRADAPEPSACGAASDAALALRATGPEQATLQRFALGSGSGTATPVAGGAPAAPILKAQSWDKSACKNGTPTIQPPLQSGGGSVSSGSEGSTTTVVETTEYVEQPPPAEVTCGSSTQSEQGYYASDRDDSCSSDSSSTSSSGDDSCSSDSSSTSSSGDDSCSSDSSSTSSSGDDSCSSDSSSSGESSGCDGDSNSGYDGDTCTAKGAPGAEHAEKLQAGLTTSVRGGTPQRARPKRLKLSLWTVGFAATLLPIRRRKRAVSSGG